MRLPLWLDVEVRGFSWRDFWEGLALVAVVVALATAIALS